MRRGGHTGTRVVLSITWGLLLASVSIMTAEEPLPRLALLPPVEAVPEDGPARHALVIAAGRCAEGRLPEARLAVSDARWFHEVLSDPRVGQFPQEHSTLLVGDDATLPRIRQALGRLQHVAADDVVVVFFSGYVASEKGKVYWLTRESLAGILADTALSHAELGLLLRAIPSKRVVVVLDGQDASTAGADVKLARADLNSVMPTLLREGRTVLAGHHGGGAWIESRGIRHGALAHFLVGGLRGAADGNGDGSVSVAELWRYVEYQMARERGDRPGLASQPIVLAGGEFDPDRVYLTVNPQPADILRGRLEAMLKLLGQGAITGDEYDEGRRLLTGTLLRDRERRQRDVYVDLADGRIDPPIARIALAAAVAVSSTDRRLDSTAAASMPATLRNSLRMDLVLIPDGSFEMGSGTRAEELSARFGGPPEWFLPEFPPHRVRINKPFYMSTCEVTVGQFRVFADETGYRTDAEKGGQSFENGKRGGYTILANRNWGWRDTATWKNPGFDQKDDEPVVLVSWNDADMFCKWLSARDNRDYRLPTEAEWEYACRAGGNTIFWWGDRFEQREQNEDGTYTRLVSWSPLREQVYTHPVGTFRANGFGLYDMAGNVWEWCNDWYGQSYYAESPGADPQGPNTGVFRVIRGGAWHDNPRYCRSSCRNGYRPTGRHGLIGFRVVAEAR